MSVLYGTEADLALEPRSRCAGLGLWAERLGACNGGAADSPGLSQTEPDLFPASGRQEELGHTLGPTAGSAVKPYGRSPWTSCSGRTCRPAPERRARPCQALTEMSPQCMDCRQPRSGQRAQSRWFAPGGCRPWNRDDAAPARRQAGRRSGSSGAGGQCGRYGHNHGELDHETLPVER